MKLKKLRLSKIEYYLIILMFLSGFFVSCKVLAKNDIRITEIGYNPEGKDNVLNQKNSYEWVRLKNISQKEINISDWSIRLGNYYNPFTLLKTIPKEGEVVLFLGAGEDSNLNFEEKKEALLFLNKTGSKLGDSKGEVVLYSSKTHNENTLVDYVVYSFLEDVDNLGLFFEKLNNYKDAILAGIWKENCFVECKKEELFLSVDKNLCRLEDDYWEDKEDDLSTIRINEILPNPEGLDKDEEFIELYNFGDKSIDLEKGWFLLDRVGEEKNNKYKNIYFKTYEGEKNIKPRSFLVFKKEKNFNFTLSDSDEIILKNSQNKEVDRVRYIRAKEGFSYSFDDINKKWRWSEFLTPAKENIFGKKGQVKFFIPENVYKKIYADFEVEIFGVKKEKAKIRWDFGDGKKSYQAKTRHKYLKNGNYLVSLKFFDGDEDKEEFFNIKVNDFPEREIKIIAINPNPKGDDSKGEWIELKNKDKKKVNLKNWSIASGENKKKLINHPIFEDFELRAGKTGILTRDFSNFSLNNKKGYIELRYPNGEVVYKIKYENEDGVKEDEIFRKKEGEGWNWEGGVFLSSEAEFGEKKEENIVTDENLVNDMDLIPDITQEDIGKFSLVSQSNIFKDYLIKNTWRIKRENVYLVEKNSYVLGVFDNKNKKIRLENHFYYFNPKTKKEKHYFWKFLEKFTSY